MRNTSQTCPICGKLLTESEASDSLRPFCSQRCRLIDLGRWLDERYRISTEMPDGREPLASSESDATQ